MITDPRQIGVEIEPIAIPFVDHSLGHRHRSNPFFLDSEVYPHTVARSSETVRSLLLFAMVVHEVLEKHAHSVCGETTRDCITSTVTTTDPSNEPIPVPQQQPFPSQPTSLLPVRVGVGCLEVVRSGLLGDAAHPMIQAGLSAGAVLHDARLLTSWLGSGGSLLDAIRAYETEMLDHGFAAVEASARNQTSDTWDMT